MISPTSQSPNQAFVSGRPSSRAIAPIEDRFCAVGAAHVPHELDPEVVGCELQVSDRDCGRPQSLSATCPCPSRGRLLRRTPPPTFRRCSSGRTFALRCVVPPLSAVTVPTRLPRPG